MNITDRIGLPALLEQTAEEASELSHAAQKMARILRAENPTPVSAEAARAALNEEYADVYVCASLLVREGQMDLATVVRVAHEKLERWERRLDEAEVPDD